MKYYDINDDLCTVIVDKHKGCLIRLPNGAMLPGITDVLVDDKFDGPTSVTVTLHCNLEPSGSGDASSIPQVSEKTTVDFQHEIDSYTADLAGKILIQQQILDDLGEIVRKDHKKWWYRLFVWLGL